MEQTCGNHFDECILFIDVLHEHPQQSALANMQRWAAKGTLTVASHPGVGVQGSEEEEIFIEMVRTDVSEALGIGNDYVAVVDIQTPEPLPMEQPPSGELWYLVTYSVTSEESEVGALRSIHTIEHQSTQPDSLLLQGDATHAVISAGEVAREITLHPCTPVFLGPDIGFVGIHQWDATAGACALDMSELQRVCGHFYTECLRFLFPGVPCSDGLVIANSDRGLANPCSGEVGMSCEYNCADGCAAAGAHTCRSTGTFEGGACHCPSSCTDRIMNGDETGVDCGGSCPRCQRCESAVLNSRTNCSGTQVDAICRVECNPGFVLSGEFLCGRDGQFSGGVCNRIPRPTAGGNGHWYACIAEDHSYECTPYGDEQSCSNARVEHGQACNWEAVGHAPDPAGSAVVSLTLALDMEEIPSENLVLGGDIRENPARLMWVEQLVSELSSVMGCDSSRLRFDSVRAASVIITFVIFPGTPDALELRDVLAQAIENPTSPLCTHDPTSRHSLLVLMRFGTSFAANANVDVDVDISTVVTDLLHIRWYV